MLVLLPEAEAAKLAILQTSCRELSLPLIGGIFPALLLNSAFVTEGVWLLRLNPMPPAGLLANLNTPGADPAEQIATAIIPHLAAARTTLFMIFDAMIPNIASILDGLYLQLADRVRYVGVNAGSETFQPLPCLFDQQQLIANGVLWLLLPEDCGAILEHGYQAPEQLLAATATEGNRIISIDWRPAFEAYQELMCAQYHVELTPENFYQYATHFPFGILRANDEIIVRIPVALEADGSLFCIGEIPPNAVLTLLQASKANSQHTVDWIARGLAELHGPTSGRNLLVFYCAGRRLHLGADAPSELVDLSEKTGVRCLAGGLSLGEIGNNHEWGYPLFHNATMMCITWNPE
ncbi:MAG: FIST N-terminal domain-containing protein [Candidatus Competibacteraceae bacterium]